MHDVNSNIVDNYTVKNDLFIFLECANYRELENYKVDDEGNLSFPKLEQVKEIALGLVSRICTAQAKADDGKKKQAKGAVEEQKNITEQLVVP